MRLEAILNVCVAESAKEGAVKGVASKVATAAAGGFAKSSGGGERAERGERGERGEKSVHGALSHFPIERCEVRAREEFAPASIEQLKRCHDAAYVQLIEASLALSPCLPTYMPRPVSP